MKKLIVLSLLVCSTACANVGTVCFAKRGNHLIYQVMKHPKVIGSRCMIQNASYVPVYEGVTGKCYAPIDCKNVMNVEIRK